MTAPSASDVAGLEILPELATVRWRATTRRLVGRGLLFAVVGVALPVMAITGVEDAPLWGVVLAGGATGGTAAWFAQALRAGWEIDDHGIVTATGTRRPVRIPWGDVEGLEIQRVEGGANVLILLRGGTGKLLQGRPAEPARFHAALEAADDLDLIPPHVTITRPPGTPHRR